MSWNRAETEMRPAGNTSIPTFVGISLNAAALAASKLLNSQPSTARARFSVVKIMPNIPIRSPKAATLPSISDAEWLVMKVLWRKAPRTTSEVVEALENQTHWKPKTIHTLLSRLTKKGALGFEKKGREYLFQPKVSAEEYEYAATRSFLGRFFQGDLAPLLARFVEKEKLKPSEIERLKRILDGRKP